MTGILNVETIVIGWGACPAPWGSARGRPRPPSEWQCRRQEGWWTAQLTCILGFLPPPGLDRGHPTSTAHSQPPPWSPPAVGAAFPALQPRDREAIHVLSGAGQPFLWLSSPQAMLETSHDSRPKTPLLIFRHPFGKFSLGISELSQ